MSEISQLLTANENYAATRTQVADKYPSRKLAIVTCMDSRIDALGVLGLDLGEAHVIRNAGGRVTQDVLRSLALSSHMLGVEMVVVMQHTGCGLENVTESFLASQTGSDLDFLPIEDHAEALAADIQVLIDTPYLGRLKAAAGFLLDVRSGRVEEILRRERS